MRKKRSPITEIQPIGYDWAQYRRADGTIQDASQDATQDASERIWEAMMDGRFARGQWNPVLA